MSRLHSSSVLVLSQVRAASLCGHFMINDSSLLRVEVRAPNVFHEGSQTALEPLGERLITVH